jgi:hypothetical protein
MSYASKFKRKFEAKEKTLALHENLLKIIKLIEHTQPMTKNKINYMPM